MRNFVLAIDGTGQIDPNNFWPIGLENLSNTDTEKFLLNPSNRSSTLANTWYSAGTYELNLPNGKYLIFLEEPYMYKKYSHTYGDSTNCYVRATEGENISFGSLYSNVFHFEIDHSHHGGNESLGACWSRQQALATVKSSTGKCTINLHFRYNHTITTVNTNTIALITRITVILIPLYINY